MRTLLLGPQRFHLNATAALRSLATDGPVVTINSGWEEREDATEELDVALDHRAHHLRLFHRLTDVLAKDDRFAAAAMRFRDRHDELQAVYRLRITNTLAGLYAVQRRLPPRTRDLGLPAISLRSAGDQGPGGGLLDESPLKAAIEDTIGGARPIATWYLDRLAAMGVELAEVGGIASSDVINWHRSQVADALAEAAVVVLTGGDVASLQQTLRLFDVQISPQTPVIAWSAGAMALGSPVVLFHDFGPDGATEPEVFDRGLGRLPHLVALPHARTRLRLDDHVRCSVLAHRFADARCLTLDDGAWIEFDEHGQLRTEARVLGLDGTIAVQAPHTGGVGG